LTYQRKTSRSSRIYKNPQAVWLGGFFVAWRSTVNAVKAMISNMDGIKFLRYDFEAILPRFIYVQAIIGKKP